MKRKITFLLWLCIPLFCLAQNNPLPRYYEYDEAGNRIVRKVIPVPQAPPAPPKDSLAVIRDELQVTSNKLQDELQSFESQKSPEYYLEKIAQVEMKIYPNPATEKITLSISNIKKMQTGTLQLYNLNGQLIQTRLLSESEVDISLVGFSKGTYILKVQVNDIIENWKIIKQ